jgi:hypothetical protein
MKQVCLVVVLALLGAASAQFGFYDLDAEEGTKFRGTTGDILPGCFSVPNGICGDSGRTVFAKDSHDANLLSWYTFDDAYGLDHSGNANHGLKPQPNVGPGHDGRGQSAQFSGFDSFTVPHTSEIDHLNKLTISFWIYLTSDATDSWRVIFRKGDATADLTPTLLLFPDSRKMHIRLSTTDPAKHGLDSVTAIPLRRWTHVAVVLNYNVISLFINGVKDNEGMVTGEVLLNTGNIYIGKHAFHAGTGMYLDDFKVYSVAQDEKQIQIEASSALPGFGSNFVRLGCKSCEMQQAIEKCAGTSGYHLCRRMELQGGALLVARAMGYLDMSSDQWAAEDSAPLISLQKLGLCCLD